MAEETCKSCRHSCGAADEWSGRIKCRRYPPSNAKHPRGGTVSHWPEVGQHEWCGEWSADPAFIEQIKREKIDA